jgi:hypothetical protein
MLIEFSFCYSLIAVKTIRLFFTQVFFVINFKLDLHLNTFLKELLIVLKLGYVELTLKIKVPYL